MLPDLRNKRVLVGMSGGIDSSMTAILLQEAGAEVIGIMLKLGEDRLQLAGDMASTKCCNLDDVNDALTISVQFNFPFQVIDLQKDFTKYVIDDYVDNSSIGLTPNPCVMCNKHVKWGSMMRLADNLKCDYVATGHYAKIVNDGSYTIERPADDTKDQTYFLWNLSQDELAKTLFPLGDMKKEDVKWQAAQRGLVDLVNKSESADICFVDLDGSQFDFLLRKNPELHNLQGGEFISEETGDVIGKHKGHPFYTIGQRKGLGLSLGYPAYVTKIDAEKNQIYVGRRKHLERTKVYATDSNVMQSISDGEVVSVKIRSNGNPIPATYHTTDDGFMVEVNEPFSGGVAPGQSVVVYKRNRIVKGGIIKGTA